MAEHNHVTIGGYLATRLQEAGIRKHFAVPGDYNLLLLDEMLKWGSYVGTTNSEPPLTFQT